MSSLDWIQRFRKTSFTIICWASKNILHPLIITEIIRTTLQFNNSNYPFRYSNRTKDHLERRGYDWKTFLWMANQLTLSTQNSNSLSLSRNSVPKTNSLNLSIEITKNPSSTKLREFTKFIVRCRWNTTKR